MVMDVHAPCPLCSPVQEHLPTRYPFHVTQDGCVPQQCVNGHLFAPVIQNLRHEVLFDMGLFALKDGYLREAVVNFASAYEEMFRLFVRVGLAEAGVSKEVIPRVMGQCKLSEQSRGAFSAIFGLYTKQDAPLLSSELMGFRNRVVHQGEIPTDEMVHKFGNAVLEFAKQVQQVLQTSFPESARNLQGIQTNDTCMTLPPDVYPVAVNMDTALNHLRQGDGAFRATVTHCLEYLKNAGGNQGGFSFYIKDPATPPRSVPPPIRVISRQITPDEREAYNREVSGEHNSKE